LTGVPAPTAATRRALRDRAVGFASPALFWSGTLAVNAATVAVLAVLSHRRAAGGLPGASVVLGLSLVTAVAPGAVQLRAAADTAAGRPALRAPWRLAAPAAAALVLSAPLIAWAVSIPTAAAVLVGLQLPMAIALAVPRGALIGSRRFAAAGANLMVDAGGRLVAGIALGLALGAATGIAAALLVATLLALAVLWDREAGATKPIEGLASSAAALAAVGLLANADLLLAPRVLGDAGAERFDVAALPAQGIFLVLFAASWLAVPGARHRAGATALHPVALTLLAGAVGAMLLMALRPVVAALLDRPQPSVGLLAPLALAKAMIGATAVAVNVAVARSARRPWRAPLIATLLLAGTAALATPGPEGLAFLVLAAQAAALVAAAAVMTARPRPSETVAPVARPSAPRPAVPVVGLTVASLALVAVSFVQAPGRILADTKLDLAVDPAGFLGRALHLWDPSAAFGQIQNQAVGYLLPMGPFFAGGHGLGLPMWVVQRLWIALVLAAAMWGLATLARELAVGGPTQWVVAGAAYALSPYFVTAIASTSAGLLPAALAPWALVPLVRGWRAGSVHKSAAWSGVAIAGMGGVNAASTLAALPLPALWLATRPPSPRRRALAGWWIAAVVCAASWWALPLLLQRRWGFDFVPFTESADTTQATTSAFEAVRGTGAWLSYLHLGGAWLPAGWALASSAGLVFVTAALAAAGLAGLAHAPERGFLVGSVLLGAALVSAAYAGPAGGALGAPARELLASGLSPLRNTAKFEPVLRVPLALGLAATLAAASRIRLCAAVSTAAALALVLVAALPLLEGRSAQTGSPQRIPAAWRDLAGYLDRQAGDERALLVPGAPFGEYTWGRPLDEPLQPLARSPWAVRSLIPLGGTASTNLLDAIERRLQTGERSPGLQDALARAGIRYVVARNDLDWRRAGAPRPAQVHDALVAAGLRRVAAFGPPVREATTSPLLSPDLGIGRYEARRAQLEVFAVRRRTSMVAALPAARAITISGGAEAIPQLLDQRVLRPDDPAVTAADRAPAPRRWIVTDSLRRRDVDFGLVHDNASYTLAPGEQAAGRGGRPRQLLDRPPADHEAVIRMAGIERVTASSYGSWLLQLPALAPWSAFDGDSSTAWVAGVPRSSVGQWIQASLARPVSPSRLEVRLLEDGPWRPQVRRLRVTTATGSAVSAVRPDESLQRLDAPAGPTTWLRIGFDRVDHERQGGAPAGIRDVALTTTGGALRAFPWVQVAQERGQLARSAGPSAPPPVFAFTRLRADPRNPIERDEEPQLRRRFTMPRAARMRLQVSATPARGGKLDRLLGFSRGLRVSGSSSWNGLPGYRPENAVDGSVRTTWVAGSPQPPPARTPAAPGERGLAAHGRAAPAISPVPAITDARPTLRLGWRGRRHLRRLRIVRADPSFAAPPLRIHLASPQGERDLVVPPSGRLRFRTLLTDRVTVTFPRVALRFTTSGVPGVAPVRLPLGLTELAFPALRDVRTVALAPRAVLRLRCGAGPTLHLDRRRIQTAVTARAGDLVALRSVSVRPCLRRRSIDLPRGGHELAGVGGSAFTVSSVVLRPAREPAAPDAPRDARVTRWNAGHRTVTVGPGPAAYLAVRENFNAGWRARLAGRRLRAVRLDGWQQGFLVPAGAGGAVDLRFAPDRWYRAALAAGAVLLVVLLALAFAPGGPAAPAARRESPGPRRVLAAGILGTAAVALVAWPVAIAAPALVVLGRRAPRAMAWLAGALVLAAGVVAAATVDAYPGDRSGGFGAVAQTLTALGLATLAAASCIPRPKEQP
jgi:arabinofuranan 3-O-arabinosyltransferase